MFLFGGGENNNSNNSNNQNKQSQDGFGKSLRNKIVNKKKAITYYLIFIG